MKSQLDDMVDKIKNTVIILQLKPNISIVATLLSTTENGYLIAFPYEIVNGKLVRYCSFTSNRYFNFVLSDALFCKDASDKVINLFFEQVLSYELDDFINHVKSLSVRSMVIQQTDTIH